MKYLNWNEKTITDFSDKGIADMYDRGYVFTRIGKGVMQQTRSVRIDLSVCELSSENRRMIKKMDGIDVRGIVLPMERYDIAIGKMAKDFYEERFGPGIMSAQKIKEMTASTASNFNRLISYMRRGEGIGYAICLMEDSMLHYSYPFYDLAGSPRDMGLGMMTLAIKWAKDKGLRYAYLGSLQRPGDVYKLQFEGLEWFDGGPEGEGAWSKDMDKVKKILASAKIGGDE